ncbi:MAG: hypothetical protein JWN40_2092 [Phycisphaerales bacterium]|nr:hypothetical protein [Phycisphaerales bacterium]
MTNTMASQSTKPTLVPLGLLLLLLGGCQIAPKPQLGHWEGPQLLSNSSVEAWSFRGDPAAHRLKTAHYLIYTTAKRAEMDALLPQVMEGALAQYQKVAPGTGASETPMECYVFDRREEWEAFTKAHTGNDASIYLQIRRGGYTIRDRYVAYDIGRYATASVAAHEGWHQYVARHFIGRLPPFLEEGLACMFEGIGWKDENLPRWNLSINQVRVQALRRAVESNKLWPLEKIIAMHAGEVVEENGEKVDAFYAQAWCFAKFLYEADNARFRPNLQKWLTETAYGTVYDPTHTHNRAGGPWNRTGVKPMVEHYLNLDFATIDKLYQAYLRKVAYDEYAAQWNS